MQHLQRASENEPFSMQSTPTPPPEKLSNEASPEELWNIWPYCWAIDGYDLVRERFHCFHAKLNFAKLCCANRKIQEKFEARLRRVWNREQVGEECEMKLV